MSVCEGRGRVGGGGEPLPPDLYYGNPEYGPYHAPALPVIPRHGRGGEGEWGVESSVLPECYRQLPEKLQYELNCQPSPEV